MADTKVISELTELVTVDKTHDWVPVVDVSDTTESVEGTTKKAVVDQFIGEKGDAATVDVGTTTTGLPGSDASVVNSGSTSAAVLDFTIPRGATGATGAQGNPGADGVNAYCYIAYASDANGTDFTNTFNSALDYIAILSTDTEITTPQASDFAGLWKNYKGTQGIQGIQGIQGNAGVDGDNAYVYIAYASDASGTDFTMTFNALLDYIAIKSTTTVIVSPSASDFTGLWKNYKGAQGIQGIQGVPGNDGADGLDINWLGAYDNSTNYVINDAVSYGGSSYICKLASTGNVPTNTTYWDLMAQKGTDGAGSGDVVGPTGAVDGNVVLFDGVTGKLIKDGGFVPEDVANKVTAISASSTDIEYPSAKTVYDSIKSLSSGAGGFAANLYFTNVDSDVSGYKKISYVDDVGVTELSGTITNEEALFRTYLFDDPIETTVVDAGLWVANFRAKVSNAVQTTQLKLEIFVRHADTSETTLFSAYSDDINNTGYEVIRTTSNQGMFTVVATDRLGARVYGKTTSPTAITIYTTIGDDTASYFTTPLAFRHEQLRDLGWADSGHTGSASNVAGFDGSGDAANYPIDTDLTSVSASDDTVPSAKATKTYIDSTKFTWRGSWATGTGYLVNNVVENNGNGYVCTQANSSSASNEPGVGGTWTEYWDLLVEGWNKDAVETLTNKTIASPLLVDGTNGTIKLSAETDGGDFNLFHEEVGTKTLAIYGSVGNTMNVDLLDGNLTVAGTTTLNGAVAGSGVLDEDDMASNSATKLATQQSIKAYVDSGTTTLTNKTIDGDDNTVQDLPYSAIKSTSRSGADTTLITGTKGTSGDLAQWNADGDLVAKTLQSLVDLLYPIGTIYHTTSTDLDTTTKMNAHFGGTWEAYGSGRVLVAKSSDTEFDTIGETGGVKTVTLTSAQSGVPAHTHWVKPCNTGSGGGYVQNKTGSNASSPLTVDNSVFLGTTLANDTANASESHTNLQPYIVVYRYRRVS